MPNIKRMGETIKKMGIPKEVLEQLDCNASTGEINMKIDTLIMKL